MPQFQFNCPQCGESLLPTDRFCFHCGRRLPAHKMLALAYRLARFGLPQSILAVAAVASLLAAAYLVHRQSQVIARALHHQPAHLRNKPTKPHAVPQAGGKPLHPAKVPILHPVVVTTSTTSPRPARSSGRTQPPPPKQPGGQRSGNWVTEQRSYQQAQFSLAVPSTMRAVLAASPRSWTWGDRGTPYHVTVAVVPARPPFASVTLGAETYGTAITQTANAASQQLFINWAGGQWVEVAMTVPRQDANWLAAMAESIRVS